MKERGYITALGTPLDSEGNFLPDSMAAHIESQIAAGAAALLCMGSMGQQPYIADSQVVDVAKTCVDTIKGRVPVYIGVSDVSVRRVKDRLDAFKGLHMDGVVSTASYYYAMSQEEIVAFYRKIADESPYPVYLYDLPPVSRAPFTPDTVINLMAHPNIGGIKSANITMLRSIMRNPSFDAGFDIFFSGLDIMDVALSYGISHMLDGMFACTPNTSAKLGGYLADGDIKGAGKTLDGILKLRDRMAEFGIWSSFTYVMNRLGFPGYFNPDYVVLRNDGRDTLAACLKEMGEI